MSLYFQKISFILLCSFFCHHGFSQSENFWRSYLPGQPIDSILILSTNSEWPTDISIDEPGWKERRRAKERVLGDTLFPIDSLRTIFFVYEIQKMITNTKDVKKIVMLFPDDHCDHYPVMRCPSVFRDCFVFYRSGEPVYAMKICFSCTAARSTPASENAKCIARSEFLKPIMEALLDYDIIDFMTREY